MSIKINEVNNNYYLNKEKDLSKKEQIEVVEEKKVNINNKSEVDIAFMNQLQKLKTESSTNQNKIDRLKNEISSNQYSINFDRLSNKIMKFEIELQKLKD